MTPPPEVLLVAFHYPPEVSGGIPRALAFEDQLVQRGCRVRVLTPQPAVSAARGGELLKVPLPGLVQPVAGGDVAAPAARSGLLRTLARRFVFVPDGFVLWTRRAVREARRSAAERPIDLVVTSSPPESMHGIGRRLQRALGCSWLADMRDGWTFEPHRPEASIPVRAAVERRMEAGVVRRANWVTAATAPLAEDLRRRYPARAAVVHLLPTGFEGGRVRAPVSGEQFVMMYTGRMGLSRGTGAPKVFFEALARVLAEDPEFAAAFRLRLMGDYTEDECKLWARDPLAGCVDVIPPQPHEAALQASSRATMLLLLTPHGQVSIATRKVFDYLAVQRPIFALAQDNEAERIVTQSRAGVCVSSADVAQVAAGLRRAFASWQAQTLDRDIPCDNAQQFETDALFSQLLDGTVLPGLSR